MRNIDILPNEDLRMDEQSVLTQRELEDLHLLAAGFENNEMAKIFCVTTSTIKIQLKNIYKKLKKVCKILILIKFIMNSSDLTMDLSPIIQ